MVKKKGTFKYLFNKGNIYRGKYLSMYSSLSNKNNNYLGVCVSKKNGKSVRRNKLKRWVRETYYINEAKLKKGITIIFVLKKEITKLDVDFKLIKDEIEFMFNEANLYEKNF